MARNPALLANRGDLSASDISRESFVGTTTLARNGYLKALKAKRIVYVSGWRKTPRGFVTPLYSLGDHPDPAGPRLADEERDSALVNQIVRALETNGRMTYLEVAQAVSLSSNAIENARYTDILVKQERIHIAAWRRNRAGPMLAFYATGKGSAPKKPEPLSQAEKRRRSREKKRALFADRWLAARLMRVSSDQCPD